MPDKVCGIYGLGYNGEIKYIGQSKDIHKRYKQHCSLEQNRGNTKKQKWLRKLLISGSKPSLHILKVTNDCDNEEVALIKLYRDKGFKLVNTSDGGQTTTYLHRAKANQPWGKSHSPVQKRIMYIKRTIKLLGKSNGAEILNEKLIKLDQVIEEFGLDYVNHKLWEKYNG